MSLTLHRKVHEGLTTCPLCGTVSSKVAHLRRHLEAVHRLLPDQIHQLVPIRRTPRLVPSDATEAETGFQQAELDDMSV